MKRLVLSPSFFLILLVATSLLLRLTGWNWDDYSRLHPDERFMTTIVSRIGNPDNLTDEAKARCTDLTRLHNYFDSDCSVFNPDNINRGTYAYGTLPLYIVRGSASLAAALNLGGLTDPDDWMSYDYIHLIGRLVNALADTLTVLVTYAIGKRLFSVQHGLIAAALYTFAVLPLQLAHFWTVDILSNLFFVIGLYAAVIISQHGRVWAYILFGLAFGAALASRINLYPMAALLGLIVLFRILAVDASQRRQRAIEEISFAAASLSIAALCFRIFQPYAFVGPSITHWAINQNWLDEVLHISELSRYPTDGWPPSVQWFNRIPFVYAWYNMAVWGMGIAFGIAATGALAGALILQVRARRFLTSIGLLSMWVVVYFAATGGIHQMTMRYYLPLYSPLSVLATWGILSLPRTTLRVAVPAVIGLTAAWAVAFVHIYTQPLTRVEASQWLTDNLPPTMMLQGEDGEQLPAFIGRDAFAFSMHIFLQGESYLGEMFTLPDEAHLLGFEVRAFDSIPTTGTLQIFDQDQAPIFTFPLESDETGLLAVRAENLQDLPSGDYYWHLALQWDGSTQIRYFMPNAIWEENHEEIRSPSKFRTPYQMVSFINAAEPTQVHISRPMSVHAVIIPHVLGAENEILIRSGESLVEAARDETWNDNSVLGAAGRYVLETPLYVEPGVPTMFQTRDLAFMTGTVIATEGSWDDSLPNRFCNYHKQDWVIGFLEDCDELNPYSQGLFVNLPLQMAENDTLVKQRRMIGVLQAADYLVISSNRFYDALPRVPRRFAMSAEYYERLFDGQLGYELQQVFRRTPSLFGVSLRHDVLPTDNTPSWLTELQAEEAFSVYDHPTVYVFRNANFDSTLFPTELPLVITTSTISQNAVALDELPAATYVLPDQAISDPSLITMLVAWSIGYLVLGWLIFPLIYVLFPALPLRGFAIGRGAAWLILAFVPWWLTSIGASFFWTRAGLWLLVALFAALSATIAFRHRTEFVEYIRRNWRALLAMEALFTVALIIGLILRAVAPDLWQASRGGEKPMDFAYLNAVLRTPTFPPPNPWLAGFEINYYYFGFVLAALPIKLGGVAPEVGVNLVLATLYAVVFMIVFTLAYALLPQMRLKLRVTLALLGVVFVMLAGNLGTLKLIFAPEPNMALHRWYWYPTRILGESANRAGGAINEMPIFSFLFGDLHAHILALLPTTLFLVVLWLLVRCRQRWLGIPLGVLAGIIFMTNTWDVLLYIPLGAIGVMLSARGIRRFIELSVVVGICGLVTIAPYYLNYSVGVANGIDLWNGERSLFEPFLLVWGIPIVISVLWQLTRLRTVFFEDVQRPIEVGFVALVAVILLALPSTVATSALGLLIVVVSIVLARFDYAKVRFIHLGIGVVFAVLLSIEYLVVRGDVGRMNTVFKTSFQLWLWVGLLLPLVLYHFLTERRRMLTAFSLVLIGAGLLYPLYALPARYSDNVTGKITLDGNQFLNTLVIPSLTSPIRLADDLPLIYYLRSTITSFPVIAEWYQTEYQWNNRIAVQTGLPSVVGWANHMRQQYPVLRPQIEQRIADIQQLYVSGDLEQVRRIIDDYHIQYIVFGTLEQSVSNPETSALFEAMRARGELTLAFESGESRIYHVEDLIEISLTN